MFKFGNDNEYKVGTVLKKVLCIALTLALVVAVFTISATAGEYTSSNKSKYHLANWYGLDELPYGNDTGVVYLHTYTTKNIDLTITFDKCTPMSQYVGSLNSPSNYDNNVIIKDFVCSHLWGIKLKTSNGHFLFSCVSDSPILYTYGNTGENWKTLNWSYISTPVYRSFETVDGVLGTQPSYKTCYVYLDIDLSTIGFNVSNGSLYSVRSNYLAIDNLSGNYTKNNTELYAISFQRPLDSQSSEYRLDTSTTWVPYIFCCYPSSDCLRDWQLFDNENKNFKELFNRLSELENLSYYMGSILNLMYDQDSKLDQMNNTLDQIMHPEDYPTDGLLKDKSMSDKLDGVIGNVKTDSSASQYITSLSASFIVIRGLWDKIVNSFGFAPVIGLLLFLAFVAYLLGRALKGRSD